MRPTRLMRLPTVLCVLLLLLGSPLIIQEDLAEAAHYVGGGGGSHGSLGGNGFHGGFGGGSFRPQSIPPTGREARQHPQPGPHQYGAGFGQHGGPGQYYDRHRGWGPYYGGYVSDFGADMAAALALGTVVGDLPADVQTLIIDDETYYFDGTNYYQDCYQGIDSSYCVVPDPYE